MLELSKVDFKDFGKFFGGEQEESRTLGSILGRYFYYVFGGGREGTLSQEYSYHFLSV